VSEAEGKVAKKVKLQTARLRNREWTRTFKETKGEGSRGVSGRWRDSLQGGHAWKRKNPAGRKLAGARCAEKGWRLDNRVESCQKEDGSRLRSAHEGKDRAFASTNGRDRRTAGKKKKKKRRRPVALTRKTGLNEGKRKRLLGVRKTKRKPTIPSYTKEKI